MAEMKGKGEVKTGKVTVDVGDLYKFDPEDLSIEITGRSYSNHTFIQATDHDIYIDFLEFPGVKKEENKMAVPGVRVYMSHIAAQRMALAVLGLLNKMHDDGKISQLKPEKDQKKISTIVTRSPESA